MTLWGLAETRDPPAGYDCPLAVHEEVHALLMSDVYVNHSLSAWSRTHTLWALVGTKIPEGTKRTSN